MQSLVSKIFNLSLVAVLVIQFSGCGTIFYPERRGQKSGHLDMGIVLLDGLGLLLFLIPGIIAFAVDFSNGTIYLPGTGRIVKEMKFDPKHATMASIEKQIKDATGHTVHLDQANMQVSKMTSKKEMLAYLIQNASNTQANQLAYLKP